MCSDENGPGDVLRVEDLHKSFGGRRLFDGANLQIAPASINSLFGNNGSGKTTFLNMLGGYDSADSGSIMFGNERVNPGMETRLARAGLGRMWQTPAVFPGHTLLQNLEASAPDHLGMNPFNYLIAPWSVRESVNSVRHEASDVLEVLGLAKKAGERAGRVVLGDRKLLSIGMLIMNRSRLLLLDEPFSGIVPETIGRISALLVKLKADGRTIFMIEHKVAFAKEISDRVFQIENRRIERLA